MKNFCSRWRIAALALATVGVSGCARSQASRPPVASGPVPVQTAVAQEENVPRIIDAVGTIQALRTVAIKSQVDGVIAKIHFREGDEVKAGDLLITLDQRPFQNALRIAQANLANARAQAAQADADLKRYQPLTQQDAISREQFAQYQTKELTAQAQVEAAEAAVANAKLQLSYTEIRAPISGRTGQLELHEGALVKANDTTQSIVTINQLAPISAVYAVPENALAAIRSAIAAHSAKVTVVDRGNGISRTDGRLTFINNTVDPSTGTITLKAEFPNRDHALWPGQYVQVRTQEGVDRHAIVVPSSAVQVGQNGAQIFVVRADRTVQLRPVTVSRTFGDNSVLASGVHAGETVVTDGQLRLVPGAHVEVKVLAAMAGGGTHTARATP